MGKIEQKLDQMRSNYIDFWEHPQPDPTGPSLITSPRPTGQAIVPDNAVELDKEHSQANQSFDPFVDSCKLGTVIWGSAPAHFPRHVVIDVSLHCLGVVERVALDSGFSKHMTIIWLCD